MGLFSSNVVLLTVLLRLLTDTSLAGLERDQSIREGQYWRQRGQAAPRASYRKIHFYERSLAADPAVGATHLELAEVYYELNPKKIRAFFTELDGKHDFAFFRDLDLALGSRSQSRSLLLKLIGAYNSA